MSAQRITAVTITPVAFADPPLLNSVGVHEQYLGCGLRNRDDTGYMRRVVPGYERRQPPR